MKLSCRFCHRCISIPTPRMGSDVFALMLFIASTLFQSPLPVWGATPQRLFYFTERMISIPTPRMGSDRSSSRPCSVMALFQSPLPVWGATGEARSWAPTGSISIPTPRMGSDGKHAYILIYILYITLAFFIINLDT